MLIDVAGRPLVSAKRDVRISNPDLARFASMADVPFKALGLTVVCLACGETPAMANHPTDAEWVMECGCTRRVLSRRAS